MKAQPGIKGGGATKKATEDRMNSALENDWNVFSP